MEIVYLEEKLLRCERERDSDQCFSISPREREVSIPTQKRTDGGE